MSGYMDYEATESPTAIAIRAVKADGARVERERIISKLRLGVTARRLGEVIYEETDLPRANAEALAWTVIYFLEGEL